MLAPALGGRVVQHGDEGARGGRARGALGDGQHARRASRLGRGVVVGAHDDDRAAPAEVEPELLRAGDDVAAVGDRAARAARGGSRPAPPRTARSGARSRSTSEAISVRTIGRKGGAVSRRGRIRSRPTTSPPTRSSCVSTPWPSAISERSSALERAATASTALVWSSRTIDASSARAAARTTSGRPEPAATAAVMASSAPKSARAGGRGIARCQPCSPDLVVVPEEDRADTGRPWRPSPPARRRS